MEKNRKESTIQAANNELAYDKKFVKSQNNSNQKISKPQIFSSSSPVVKTTKPNPTATKSFRLHEKKTIRGAKIPVKERTASNSPQKSNKRRWLEEELVYFEKNVKKIGGARIIGKGGIPVWRSKAAKESLKKTGVFNPLEHQSQEAQQAFSEMIKKQLETNIIKPIQEKDVKHLNPVFVIRKKDGGWRQIVDYRRLNNAIKAIHCKQEDLRTVEKIKQEKDYAVTLDLSQANYLIKVSEELSPFLSFVSKGIHFAFHGMPFGYKDAPRTFTKVMRKVQKYMREEWNARAIAYLDDIVLFHPDPQELNIIVEKTLSMFNKWGLLVNSEKCHLIPSQQFKFLGFQWDTIQFVVQIEESKKTELMKECKKWRRIAQFNRVVSTKKFASLIGKLNVNASITKCLGKWSERLKENQPRKLNPVFRPEAILTTDASGFAIGATL
ncbi:putative Reverse transcriptase (RNA-dependent DNA polymerase) [Monocercomonoides exilis]|uniref:putative Reverse transcriptase (RNA-dependent DNA polymerase) n=1 Tax=Monocercomonoides exilis TaxID=2049356 RepID=UPI003559FB26|nr:putative Reverse transcriptase (RNA-dependent DNA polymerase) [Monocercomonoides exilis]|eukprot:MONOS_9771.1-p1 / transcript=MONOS_9771.1 / gene=MONOS_9771 / organism=Monocercomonoides_exilis_PA203 / gene_product=ORF3 / transcript_product=ORF3 / location=Mono_scaffold00416:27930-29246(-) / protein_length=438 / sequence_SO=supercontig / SO=protein_coding / is_pseudo=false